MGVNGRERGEVCEIKEKEKPRYKGVRKGTEKPVTRSCKENRTLDYRVNFHRVRIGMGET